MIGQVVGQYKIVEKLGEGGMGAVYKGIDMMVEREVAIKMLRPEIARQPDVVERFRSEAVTLAKLNYPGIATLFSFFRQNEDFFMVMEFVNGRTLEAAVRQTGAMQWRRAAELFSKILEAIEPAHLAGVLHRDIKPANIMLLDWGGVKIMDFGIARVLGSSRMTREGRMVGTIEYIAPERIRGQEGDARADLYSLGIVFYELLTGHIPWESPSEFEIMRGHMQEPPPPLSRFGVSVPQAIEDVLHVALAKSPNERFESCGAFRMALAGAASSVPEEPGAMRPTRLATGGYDIPGPGMAAMKPTRYAGAAVATPYPPAAIPPAYQTPRQAAPPAPAAKSFLSQLTWKHAVGAGVGLIALVIGIVLATQSKPVPQSTQPQTSVTTPSATQPQAPAVAPPEQPQSADDVVKKAVPLPQPVAPEPTAPSAPSRGGMSEAERRAKALKALEQ